MEIVLLFLILILVGSTSADYWTKRQYYVDLERSQAVGSAIVLNEKEAFVNKYILMNYKTIEYDAGFKNSSIFAPNRHFFDIRDEIEKSLVFNFIKKMPKGSALHGHDVSMASEDYVYSLTFRDNLYGCIINGRLQLKFLDSPLQDNKCNWKSLYEMRRSDPNFAALIRSQLTIKVENPKQRYKSLNEIWSSFMDTFDTVFGMVTYKPVFEDLFYHTLKELYEDNVMYLEFRGILPEVYELNGTVYSQIEVVQIYDNVIKKFKTDYPDFVGARLIFAPLRGVSDLVMSDYVKTVLEIKKNFPNVLAGFDLVGQEDLGRPLTDFVDSLLEMSSNGIDFFFHAGETDWYGTTSDFNLLDAVLLGTKRIGHGFALAKHPTILKLVKELDIAVEICPIANQITMLVQDLRNHPGASMIAQGVPVVISYDDPSFWSSKGLSYDFYIAFMGLAGKNADLRFLKQIANNSITYSAMPEDEKRLAYAFWEDQWKIFIDNVINENKVFYDMYKTTLGIKQFHYYANFNEVEKSKIS